MTEIKNNNHPLGFSLYKGKTPEERLMEIFTEADQIIENHPELVEPLDEEQFNRVEKLVEGVETDDLPTRLRELTQDLIQCSNQLINHAQQKMEDKNFEHFDKWMTRVEKMLPVIDEAPGWADELEKEE